MMALSIMISDEGRLYLNCIPDKDDAEENTSTQTESIPRTITDVRQGGTMQGSARTLIRMCRAETWAFELSLEADTFRDESWLAHNKPHGIPDDL
jgi:hypothetical protein